MKTDKVSAIDFLWVALYAFAGFGLEILLSMVEPKGPVYQHSILTSIIWGLAAVFLTIYSKKRLEFDVFSQRDSPSYKGWGWIALLVVLAVGSMSVLWGGFRPVIEYRSQPSSAAFVFQYIYYLFESALIVLTIAFGQELGERTTKKNNLPWGGLLLGLTWGLMHILTQGLSTGLIALVWSVMYGLVYLLCKKNVRFAYPLIALMFIL